MDNVSESKKNGVVIFSQQFYDKLEHIPIKKRISLRDSALYHPTPSSAKESDKKDCSPPLTRQTEPGFLLKQQPDNSKACPLDYNSSEILNNDKADCPPHFSGIETPIGSTLRDKIYMDDNTNKVQCAGALSPCNESKLLLVSSFVSCSKGDGLGTKSEEQPFSVIFRSDDKSTAQRNLPFTDYKLVPSVNQDARMLWDLNVEMDAWEKPTDHLNVEFQSDVTSSECMPNTKLDVSEDFMLKGKTIAIDISTPSETQPNYTSMNSGGICKYTHKIPDSTGILVCESVREDQQVADGTCPDRALSGTEQSIKIGSMNISCNQKLISKTDEHFTRIFGESASMLSPGAPKRNPGSLFETTNYCSESTEEQNCEKKNHLVTLEEKIIAETAETVAMVHHLSEEISQRAPEHVDDSMQNKIPDSFQQGCDVPGEHDPVAAVFKEVPNTDKDYGGQNEQDYEDGELRDLDTHCWNEIETDVRETECLDYEHVDGSIDKLADSSTSVSVIGEGAGRLKSTNHISFGTLMKDQLVTKVGTNSEEKVKVISRLCSESYLGTHTSNTNLERKHSGWDQLPKDDHTSLDKVQETHRISSRTSRSELQVCMDIPTLSEDAEEKETVLERRIRPKDMDDSYPAEGDSGFDNKFSGKRRSTAHMHGRNRVEDWDSEHRSSVNYHDLYDNHSGSRPLIMNSKGRECLRSRSPSVRSEAYDACANYSRYSRGRYGRHAEGSVRSFRGARNGYRGCLTDDRDESEFRVRHQIIRRDRNFSPRVAPHFSGTFNRSRSRSRTRSPPMWLPPYERMGSRGQRRSPEFGAEDRAKRIKFPFWKSSFTSDNAMRYASPPRGGFIPQNKPRWNDNDDFDTGDPRDRSPVRSFRHKENFNATCSRGRFKSIEDFRPTGYRGRMRQIAPDRVRGDIGGSDRRKREDSYEAGHQKRFYKDDFTRQYRHDAEDNNIAAQNCPLKEDFVEDGETGICNIRNKESSSHEFEYDKLSYPGSTPNAKR
ncbi:unnamed protein product [Rhodiola kirilowii]